MDGARASVFHAYLLFVLMFSFVKVVVQTTFVYLLNIDMVIDRFQNYAEFLSYVKGAFLVYVLFAGAFETAAIVCVAFMLV